MDFANRSNIKCINALQAPSCQFPCVFKVGHAHGGLGKVKVENETTYQVRYTEQKCKKEFQIKNR